ncbi:TPA: GntR family transcriptional regulator [Streptococcus agalactiae]|uniref:GntR family transcriptional regulator n=1 Tax=Ezakiella peruensis TaxID=1464038 RepID=UPI000C1B522C|nr:GntR family transcriptional regulator [Ezakiella peruensis]
MKIIISNNRTIPIYEQIYDQIKTMIVTGKIKPGSKITSMRMLAKQLKVSIITVQRAYDELQSEGFIETSPGKGCYVLEANVEILLEEKRKKTEDLLKKAIESAKKIDLGEEEFIRLVKVIYREDE